MIQDVGSSLIPLDEETSYRQLILIHQRLRVHE
jgi:hypothetical protein